MVSVEESIQIENLIAELNSAKMELLHLPHQSGPKIYAIKDDAGLTTGALLSVVFTPQSGTPCRLNFEIPVGEPVRSEFYAISGR